jgi:hypothetical protein
MRSSSLTPLDYDCNDCMRDALLSMTDRLIYDKRLVNFAFV